VVLETSEETHSHAAEVRGADEVCHHDENTLAR
jgi:hypothetical protein